MKTSLWTACAALALPALAGCGSTTTEATAAPALTAPAPAAAAPGAREIELTIAPDALAIDDVKGKVLYKPDSRRQTDHYTTYEFDAAQFKGVVGEGNLKKALKLRVAVLADRSESSSPADPNMPRPAGGFTYQTLTCKVLEVLAAE